MTTRPGGKPWTTPQLRTLSDEEIARRPELQRAFAELFDAASPDASAPAQRGESEAADRKRRYG